jgi:hypothetical protein
MTEYKRSCVHAELLFEFFNGIAPIDRLVGLIAPGNACQDRLLYRIGTANMCRLPGLTSQATHHRISS